MRYDFGVFILVATSIHIAAAATSYKGSESAGGGGEALVSLQGANAQAAMMVQEWNRPPDVPDTDKQPDAPEVETPPMNTPTQEVATPSMPSPSMDLPESPSLDLVNVETVTTLQTPSLQREPDLQMTVDQAPSQTEVAAMQPPELSEVAFQPPETHVQGMVIPVSRPESIAENHPVAERTQVATQALQSQQAAGDGTEPEAGAANADAAISDGDHAQLVQVWGGQIRRAIERQKRYPRKAQSRGERGVATVSVRVDANGSLLDYSLQGSTGSSLLDAAALEAVTRAGSFPAAPTGLKGNAFGFRFRIVFE